MAGLDPAIHDVFAKGPNVDAWHKAGHDNVLIEGEGNYFGARLARMRWSVRRCMLSRRAVSETLRLHSS